MPRPYRMAPALLLVAILATPAVLANPLGGAYPQRSVILASCPMDSIAQFWHLLVRVLRKNGGQADPNGVQTKNGGQIDPNGNNSQSTAPPAQSPDNDALTPHG